MLFIILGLDLLSKRYCSVGSLILNWKYQYPFSMDLQLLKLRRPLLTMFKTILDCCMEQLYKSKMWQILMHPFNALCCCQWIQYLGNWFILKQQMKELVFVWVVMLPMLISPWRSYNSCFSLTVSSSFVCMSSFTGSSLGRLVDSQSLRKALELVYANFLPKNSHPFIYMR